jgi:hypothetical protein
MVVRLGHESFLVGEHLATHSTPQLVGWRYEVRGPCALKHRQSPAPDRGALSGAHSSTTPRELPFEGGDPIAKRGVLGLLIAQSLGEVQSDDHERPEQYDQHALSARHLPWPRAVGGA